MGQDTSGTLGVWLMNGTTPIAEAAIGNPGANWKVVGAADYNGDGRDDILLQNTVAGNLQVDLMNGTTVASTVSITVDPSWHAVSTGEFNGQAVIAWQNNNGTPGIWLMNGTTPAAAAGLSNPGAGWQLISIDHFTMPATSFSVGDIATLNTDIRSIDVSGANAASNTNYTITLTGNITLDNAGAITDLLAINLMNGSTLTIDGGGNTLDGGGATRGLFVYSGTVTVNDLTVANAVAVGGAGGPGGGAGAGLGGGLFVASAGNVTLNNVIFSSDRATGGAGGTVRVLPVGRIIVGGGGGGMGGNGGTGGGGVGRLANGGGIGAGAGIIAGAASGGVGQGGVGGTGGGGGSGGIAGGGGGVGGGGGAGGNDSGGNGGFGGGGGSNRGVGGFGGGGDGFILAAIGGFGGGRGGGSNFGVGAFGGGGGGLGAGGDVFVQQGGTLTIEGGSLSGGSVTAGAGGLATNANGANGKPGAAYGSGIFIQGNETITFAPGSGQTLTIGDVIADMTGSHDASGQVGAGNILVGGGGTVRLEADNTYTGSTTLAGNGTRLELFRSDSAGSGAIVLAGSSATTLQIDGTTMPTNGILNMTGGDIDLRGLAFHAGATVSSSGNTLTVTSGSSSDQLTLIVPANTNFSPPVSDGFGGTQFGLGARVPFDFNGDGNSDLAFQNNGTPGIWLMNGATPVAETALPNPGASWHIVTSRDVNGDGMADLIWQNDNGMPGIWLMNATTPIAEAGLTNPGTSWHLLAAGDLNGDGMADLIWQDTSGTPGVWLMNGTTPIAEAAIGNPGANWKVVGAADYNGDGRDDILLQNTVTGNLMIDLMNGTTVASTVSIAVGDASWHAVSTGEFNGQAVIAWQNNNGTPGIWLMNGTTPVAAAGLSNPGAGWQLISIDHFTPNGQADLLFQNTNGALGLWEMNGTSVAAMINLPNPGAGWQSVNGHPFASG